MRPPGSHLKSLRPQRRTTASTRPPCACCEECREAAVDCQKSDSALLLGEGTAGLRNAGDEERIALKSELLQTHRFQRRASHGGGSNE